MEKHNIVYRGVYRVDLNFVIFKIILIAVFISKHTVKATWVLMFFVYLSG